VKIPVYELSDVLDVRGYRAWLNDFLDWHCMSQAHEFFACGSTFSTTAAFNVNMFRRGDVDGSHRSSQTADSVNGKKHFYWLEHIRDPSLGQRVTQESVDFKNLLVYQLQLPFVLHVPPGPAL
jgi:hypothetical protein